MPKRKAPKPKPAKKAGSVKPVKAWAYVSHDGEIQAHKIELTRQEAKSLYMQPRPIGQQSIIPVLITPI